jgi:thiol-disulfide isomerase/thioredoxin
MSRSKTSLLAILALGLTMGCKATDDGEMDMGADNDGDGISNGDELEIGTDPENADTDGDGFDDAREWQDGTNPNYEYSHSYTGDYRIGFCETPPESTGPTLAQTYTDPDSGTSVNYSVLQNGDVPENFIMMDQNGEDLNLYSFCGRQVMVVVSAGWCGPCRAEAETLQQVAAAYPEVQIITMLTQDNAGDTPNLAFLQQWESDYGFENIAIVAPTDPAPTTMEEYFNQTSTQWDIDGYIPTMYHLDETMTVFSADESVAEPPHR